jgi:D-glycero-D-manno-heptose 1,7-bisphosphate phosphatase
MILAAAAELELDLARSWLVGDAERDIDAGIAAGLARERCIRIGAPGVPGFAAAADAVLRAGA